jgi:putative transposase
MARPPLHIDVPKKDQQELRELMKGGVQQVRVVLRALALLQLAGHTSAPQIARVNQLSRSPVRAGCPVAAL